MSYRFHASAPPGEWINDPNALDFHDGRYRLHVQHAADAPDFKRVGWGRFTSRDLFGWRWEGVAIPPDAGGDAYSGSVVVADGAAEAYLTRHRPDAEPRQIQVRRALASGAVDSAPIGPGARNCRDPFVFHRAATDDWRMLVAEPCDWEAWRAGGPSRLALWRSKDRLRWEPAGLIGPWRPPGVMWEVPALIDFGDAQVLIVSEVDRRDGAAACAVRYWPGRFDGVDFAPHEGSPEGGCPLDLGPDFYAAIPNVEAGWPAGDRVILGWASSWATARRVDWPEARGGGPISLPRRVRWDAATARLRLRPIKAASRWRYWTGDLPDAFRLTIARTAGALTVTGDAGVITVRREAADLDWSARHPLPPPAGDDAAELFVDGPLLELFLGRHGVPVTAVLPGDDPPTVTIDAR